MNILKKKKGEACPVVKREYTHEMTLFILGMLPHSSSGRGYNDFHFDKMFM